MSVLFRNLLSLCDEAQEKELSLEAIRWPFKFDSGSNLPRRIRNKAASGSYCHLWSEYISRFLGSLTVSLHKHSLSVSCSTLSFHEATERWIIAVQGSCCTQKIIIQGIKHKTQQFLSTLDGFTSNPATLNQNRIKPKFFSDKKSSLYRWN